MNRLSAVALCAILTTPTVAQEGTTFPATLVGHAVLPAETFIAPPEDAPVDAAISGKFAAGPDRIEEVGSVEGNTGGLHGRRGTGVFYPFEGQPVQGFSGFAMNTAEDGAIYALTDNGFGSKLNSPDALLFFHKIDFDWDAGTVDRQDTVFLKDPNKVVPFRIAHEGTEERYLTGSDFDLESIQVLGDMVWIGEEFGPYLISATLDGVVTGLFPTMLDGEELRSPDHPSLRIPAVEGTDFTVPRSGGYEGMALQPGTSKLWAMLEKPLVNAETETLVTMAFNTEAGEWTGEVFRFPLAEGATAIGDFNFVDETRALVIERDNGEGDPSLQCEGEPNDACFPNPALLKRVVLIDTADVSEDGMVRRIGHIDLMNINDPEGVARLETAADRDLSGIFTLPFFTIEDVMRVEGTDNIIVGTDNNLPFSSGRELDEAMNNEFVLLAVPEMLAAE